MDIRSLERRPASLHQSTTTNVTHAETDMPVESLPASPSPPVAANTSRSRIPVTISKLLDATSSEHLRSYDDFVKTMQERILAMRPEPKKYERLQAALLTLPPHQSLEEMLPVANKSMLDALSTFHNEKIVDLTKVNFLTSYSKGKPASAIEYLIDLNLPAVPKSWLTSNNSGTNTGHSHQAGERNLSEQLQRLRQLGVPLVRDKANSAELLKVATMAPPSMPAAVEFLLEAGLDLHTRSGNGVNGLDVILRSDSRELGRVAVKHALAHENYPMALQIAFHQNDPSSFLMIDFAVLDKPQKLQSAFTRCHTLPSSGEHNARFIANHPVLASRLLDVALSKQDTAAAAFIKRALLGPNETTEAQQLVFHALQKAIEKNQVAMVDVLLTHGDDENPPKSLKLTATNDPQGNVNNLMNLLTAAQRKGLTGESQICRNLLSYGHRQQMYEFQDNQFKAIDAPLPNINLRDLVQGRRFAPRLTGSEVMRHYGRSARFLPMVATVELMLPFATQRVHRHMTPDEIAEMRPLENSIPLISRAGLTYALAADSVSLYRTHREGDDANFKQTLLRTLDEIQNLN